MLTLVSGGDEKQLFINPHDVEDITTISSCKNKILQRGGQGTRILPGDLLQFGLDENGDINAVRFLFTPTATEFYEWTSGEWGTASADNFFGETASFYGSVIQKNGERFIISAQNGWLRNFAVSSAAVYALENGKLKAADTAEINPGDTVACCILSGSVKIILKLM